MEALNKKWKRKTKKKEKKKMHKSRCEGGGGWWLEAREQSFLVHVRVYKCLRTGDIKVRGDHRKAGLGTCFLVHFAHLVDGLWRCPHFSGKRFQTFLLPK